MNGNSVIVVLQANFYSLSSQIQMSVLTTMVVVIKPVLTLLVTTHVPVKLGTSLMMTAMLVMVCLMKYIRSHCAFYDNYTPDVNECELSTDLCHHTCFNTVGSYLCDCNVGYMLNSQGVTCIGKCMIVFYIILE